MPVDLWTRDNMHNPSRPRPQETAEISEDPAFCLAASNVVKGENGQDKVIGTRSKGPEVIARHKAIISARIAFPGFGDHILRNIDAGHLKPEFLEKSG